MQGKEEGEVRTVVAVLTGFFGGFLLSVILFEMAVRSVKKGDARAKRMRSHRRTE